MAELSSTTLINDSSLKGYWKMDSTTDSSGNGGTLTLVNAPSYAAGKFGNGLDLETSSAQWAYAADSAPLSITGSMSISCWVNFESLPTSGETKGLVTKFDVTGNNRSFLFRLYNDTGTLKVEASADQTGASSTADGGYWTPSLSTGIWYHFVLTVTPGNASATTFELFINGVSQGNGTMTLTSNITSIYDGTAVLGIGAAGPGGAGELDGLIDDVAIFSKVLSSDEILTLYRDSVLPSGSFQFI